ncbi:MAG: BatD family protein [Calditrichia bacterium]
MINRQFGFSILILLVTFVLGFSQDIKITAHVDKNPVGADEQFTYEVEVSGASQSLPDVDLPDFADFAILGGPSVSSSYQIVNFNMSASKSYSMVLMPRQTGTFKIGPAAITYKGKTIKSNTVDVTVTKQSGGSSQRRQAPGRSSRGSQNESDADLSKVLFLDVIPSKRTVYVNQEVTLRYKIYFRTQITNNEVSKLPEAVGSWVEEYPIDSRPKIYTENVKGVQYNVAEIKKMAVFPSRPGKITISPLELIVETVVRRRRRSTNDLFDNFFSDPFGQVVKKRISSGPVEIKVLPLPEAGKPDNFSGLVGDFKIHSSVDKQATETNDAISYKVNISGRGLLQILNNLPVEFPPDFEVYDPKVNQSVNKSGAAITSNKEFEYVLIPRAAGEQRIKAVEIPYFNPQDRRYHSLKIPEYKIRVAQGKEVAMGVGSGAGLSKEEVRLLGKDIRFIKEDVAEFRPIGELPYENVWFIVSLVLPLLVLGAAWGYRNHLEKMSSNVQYARSRKAGKHAQMRLKEAKTFLNQKKAAEFYSAVSRGLIGYVADKTNQPAAGLLRDDVKGLLLKSNINGELESEFMTCLDEADFRRFAPGEVTDADMKNFYQKSEKILMKLGKFL